MQGPSVSAFTVLPWSGAGETWALGQGGEWGHQAQVLGEEGSWASAQSVTPSLVQERPPYNLKAFSVCISFPREYPFQPPTVKFTTRIYHPNVDRDGRVCLPIISKKNWKASTRICQGEAGSCLDGARTERVVGGGVTGPLLCWLCLCIVVQSPSYADSFGTTGTVASRPLCLWNFPGVKLLGLPWGLRG